MVAMSLKKQRKMNKFTTAHVLNLNVYLHEAAKAGIFIEL